eukprot:IDg20007t1
MSDRLNARPLFTNECSENGVSKLVGESSGLNEDLIDLATEEYGMTRQNSDDPVHDNPCSITAAVEKEMTRSD